MPASGGGHGVAHSGCKMTCQRGCDLRFARLNDFRPLTIVVTDTGKTDMGRVQRSLNEMPGTSAGNEAVNLL